MIYVIYKRCPDCDGIGNTKDNEYCPTCKGLKRIKSTVKASYPRYSDTNE